MAAPRLVLLQALTPIQKFMQPRGNPEPQITERFVLAVTALIRDGDVLISRENKKWTNPFVPGDWGHAAIYFQGRVIEAIGDYKDENGNIKNGVRSENLQRWLYQKDWVCVLRPNFASEEIRARAGFIAVKQIGKPYDYGFTPSTKAFYCSELVTYVYSEAMKAYGLESPFMLRKQLGVETSTPQDIYDASKLWIKVAEERNI